jgi:hypothetical protein
MVYCPVWAQEAPSGSSAGVPCFEVIPAAANVIPYGPILVDRCTGHTWVLARAEAGDAKGKSFAFRWFPLAIIPQEAVLAFPELPTPKPAPPPAPLPAELFKPIH